MSVCVGEDVVMASPDRLDSNLLESTPSSNVSAGGLPSPVGGEPHSRWSPQGSEGWPGYWESAWMFSIS